MKNRPPVEGRRWGTEGVSRGGVGDQAVRISEVDLAAAPLQALHLGSHQDVGGHQAQVVLV